MFYVERVIVGIFNRKKQTVAAISSFDNRCTVVDLGGEAKTSTINSKYIYDGCEFVGNYIDQKTRLAYKAPLQVFTYGVFNKAMTEEYRRILFDLKRAMRLFLIDGEVYYVYLDNRNVWVPVASKYVSYDDYKGLYTVKGLDSKSVFTVDSVKRIFVPNDFNPKEAQSELSRVQHDIVRYWKLQEELAQNVDSLSLRYGGIYLGQGTEDVAYYSGGVDGVASEVSDNQDLFGQWLTKKKQGLNTAIVYEGPQKPEPFMLSELLDERSIAQKKDCVEGFARGVNWPRALLMEGEGQGKYANEELLKRSAYENYVVPFLQDFAERLSVKFFPNGFIRFDFGWETIVERDSKIGLMLEAKKAGVSIPDDVIFEELGIDIQQQTTAAVQEQDYVAEEQTRAENISNTWGDGIDSALVALWVLRKKTLTPEQQRALQVLPIERRFTQYALDSTVNKNGLTVAQSAATFMRSPEATKIIENQATKTVQAIKPFLDNPIVSDDFRNMFLKDVERVLTIAERDASFVLNTPERVRAILDADGGMFKNIIATTPVTTYRWVHGFLRTPAKPFESHIARNGVTGSYDVVTDNGSVRPQDHKYCSCVLVPEV